MKIKLDPRRGERGWIAVVVLVFLLLLIVRLPGRPPGYEPPPLMSNWGPGQRLFFLLGSAFTVGCLVWACLNTK
jgi:hypothetical protein